MPDVFSTIAQDERPSLDEIDQTRVSSRAYLYLCHLEECKRWIESIIRKNYPDLKAFERELTNGIDLCLLTIAYAPEIACPIYYGNLKKPVENDYKYIDNIYFFLQSLKHIKLPSAFYFDTVDLYERKNIPKVIFCLHALSVFLKSTGKMTKHIKSVFGMQFSPTLLEETNRELEENIQRGVSIPEFGSIQGVIYKDTILLLQNKIKFFLHTQKLNIEAEKLKSLKRMIEQELEDDVLVARNEEIHLESLQLKSKIIHHIIDTLRYRLDTVIRVHLRTFLYRRAYLELITKRNYSIFTLKFFLFVFFENCNELEKEREIEKAVNEASRIRNKNYDIENYIDELLARVDLLLNNKIIVSNISIVKPKLEDVLSCNYQYDLEDHSLVFNILQTEPEYLYIMLRESINPRDFIIKFITAFYCNGKREEQFLIDFILTFFDDFNMEEDESETMLEYLKIIMVHHHRGTASRIKDQHLSVIKDLSAMDLENDPSKIYHNVYHSLVSREDALNNETVAKVYIARLKLLRSVVTSIVDILVKNIHEVPFPIRFYLKQIRDQKGDIYTKKLFFKEFIYPYIIAPDAFGNFSVSNDLRDKCKIIVSALECIFEDANHSSLCLLGKYFEKEKSRVNDLIVAITEVKNTQYYYSTGEQRPFVNFTCKQVNELIGCMRLNLGKFYDTMYLDLIKSLLPKLPDFPATDRNMTFFLNKTVVTKVESDIDAKTRKTKGRIVELLRVGGGRDVLDILVRQSTDQEETIYQTIIDCVKRKDNNIGNLCIPYNASTNIDEESMSNYGNYYFRTDYSYLDAYSKNGIFFKTLDEFKDNLYDEMCDLENLNVVHRCTHFNDIIYSLADDILRIKFMSEERSKELETHKSTLNILKLKQTELETEMVSIEAYLMNFAATIFKHDNPNIQGRAHKFGSFKVSATKLYSDKILLEMINNANADKIQHGDLNECYNDISFIFASDEPSIIKVETYLSSTILTNSVEFRFDELLKSQFRGEKMFEISKVCWMNTIMLVRFLNNRFVKK